MTISRRLLIKQLMLAAGGAALLPSCKFESKETTSDAFLLSGNQNELLAEMAETIIPATTIPGAKALKVEEFINVIVTDCFDKESQDKFLKGLSAVEELSKKKFNNSFVAITADQRNELFNDLDSRKEGTPQEAIDFFPMVKGLTIHGYMSSQYILTEVNPWPLVPGPARGCVEVTA
jgi:hypothetical protein